MLCQLFSRIMLIESLISMQIDLSFLIIGLYYFLRVLSFLIIARIILSWIAPMSRHPVAVFVVQTSEQIISPIRKRLPKGSGTMAMIDWSPLVALILVDLLRYGLIRMFA